MINIHKCYTVLATAVVFFACAHHLYAQDYLEKTLSTVYSYDQIVTEVEEYYADRDKGRGSGYKQFERWKYWNGRNLDAEGKIIHPAEALRAVEEFETKYGPGSQKSLDSYWRAMGPDAAVNTSTWSSHLGRISAIGLDDQDPNHFIVGSPSGGVWKTTDEGISWIPIFDNQTIINVYALAIHPQDDQNYFCGTYGMGMMKSTNGGASWYPTNGISGGQLINTIKVDPVNSNILLAVSQWGTIYRSTDTGENWTAVYSAGPDIYDMEFKPGNSNIVYASGYGFVAESIDNGQNFTVIPGPWGGGPMMMGVTSAAPDYLYVLEADQGGFGAMYLSTDGGSSFTTQSDDSSGNNNIMGYSLTQKGGQAPRDMDVVVSSTDPTEVHTAGVMTFKSTDSGVSWTQTTHWVVSNPLPFIHADCDIMIYKDGTMYFGTDGGIFLSKDGAASILDRTQGIVTRQFYRIGASQTDMDRVSGGSQDNGTGILRAGTWYDFVGADGMETFIDRLNADVVYASIQYGGLYKSITGGNSLTGINDTPGSGSWVTPLEQDPALPNTLYQGKRHLYKSVDGGLTWLTISNLTPSNTSDTKIRELKLAPSDGNTIYLAYRYQMYRTADGGANWTEVTPVVSFSYINYISVHPTNPLRVVIALSGATAKFMETTDGGANWVDITGNLPNIGAECAIYEGGSQDGIFVGMNPGAYYINPSLANWQPAMNSLPKVPVTEFDIAFNYLYMATYGRGLWKSRLGSLPPHCSDGILSGDEVWVDCDGSCNPCTDCDGETESISGLIPDRTFRRMNKWISISSQLSAGTEASLQAAESVTFSPGTSFDQSSIMSIIIDSCNN